MSGTAPNTDLVAFAGGGGGGTIGFWVIIVVIVIIAGVMLGRFFSKRR